MKEWPSQLPHSLEMPIMHSSFEEQFKTRERVDVGSPDYDSAEIVDMKPDHTRIKTDPPVLLATGYLSSMDNYKKDIETFFEEDHRVIALDYPSDGGALELTNEEVLLVEKYPEEAVRKAVTLLKILDHKGIDKVNVFAHSAGAVDAAIAALLHPEKIENIIFCCPVGLVGKDHTLRLLSGLRQHITRPAQKIPTGKGVMRDSHGDDPIRELKMPSTDTTLLQSEPNNDINPMDMDWIDKARRHPRQALAEGLGLVGADIHTLIRQLHEKGVGLYVISGTEDPIFPAEMMQSFLQKDIDMGYIDAFVPLEGGHSTMRLYAHRAGKIFDNINNKGKFAHQ